MKYNHKYYAYYRFWSSEKKEYIQRIECIYSVKQFKMRMKELKGVTYYIQKEW